MKQSIVWWCYANTGLSVTDFLRASAEAGYQGVELIPPEHYQQVRDHGLKIVAAGGHGPLEQGLNQRENAEDIIGQITEQIKMAEQWDIPVLICFSGNRRGLDDAQGAAIAAETLSKVARMAEDAGITLEKDEAVPSGKSTTGIRIKSGTSTNAR